LFGSQANHLRNAKAGRSLVACLEYLDQRWSEINGQHPTAFENVDQFNCVRIGNPKFTNSSIPGRTHLKCSDNAYRPPGAYVSTSQGFVELMYSPDCHANWAKIKNSTPGTWFWVLNSNGDTQHAYVQSGNTAGYSTMVNGYWSACAGNAINQTGWF
jgi:hypothetical protein